jgi:hypothetical protein
MDETKRLKMAIISGASHALKYKAQNPYSSDDDIIRQINKEIHSIVEKIDQSI